MQLAGSVSRDPSAVHGGYPAGVLVVLVESRADSLRGTMSGHCSGASNALKVVSIGLGKNDDPQQIFESLNATGKPLTESEKVKNWLLMGLPDEDQQVMHDDHWLAIERALGANRSTESIDIFLRDLLRWRTGEVHGIDQVYESFRRWVVRTRLVVDRPALCRDLASLARSCTGPCQGQPEHTRIGPSNTN